MSKEKSLWSKLRNPITTRKVMSLFPMGKSWLLNQVSCPPSRETKTPFPLPAEKTKRGYVFKLEDVQKWFLEIGPGVIKELAKELSEEIDSAETMKSQLAEKDRGLAQKDREIANLRRQLEDAAARLGRQAASSTGREIRLKQNIEQLEEKIDKTVVNYEARLAVHQRTINALYDALTHMAGDHYTVCPAGDPVVWEHIGPKIRDAAVLVWRKLDSLKIEVTQLRNLSTVAKQKATSADIQRLEELLKLSENRIDGLEQNRRLALAAFQEEERRNQATSQILFRMATGSPFPGVDDALIEDHGKTVALDGSLVVVWKRLDTAEKQAAQYRHESERLRHELELIRGSMP